MDRIVYLEHAVEAAKWARLRLEQFADSVMHSVVQGGGRELKRKLWGAFSDFDEALKKIDEQEDNAIHAKVLARIDALIAMARDGYIGSYKPYQESRYVCTAEAMAEARKAGAEIAPFSIEKLSAYSLKYPQMEKSKATGETFAEAAENAYYECLLSTFKSSIDQRIAAQFSKWALSDVLERVQALSEMEGHGPSDVKSTLRKAIDRRDKASAEDLLVEMSNLHRSQVFQFQLGASISDEARAKLRDLTEAAEYLSLGVCGHLDIFHNDRGPESA